MKKAFVVLLVVMGLIASAGNVFAVDNVGTASVKVLTPLALTHSDTDKLNFGSIGLTGSSGTVIIASVGGVATRTLSGGVVGYSDTTNPIALDPFSSSTALTGTETYYIGFPDSATISNGSNTMTVSEFKAYDSIGSQITSFSGVSATASFFVGAKLAIVGTEGAGVYTGTYPVYLGYDAL
ncbi:MAG TPA: DUF4402 domain-containing protein [Rectinemataceae bacterium]|nr:DUF4402 domain-containing protein [Rectinemataceae bacterium]